MKIVVDAMGTDQRPMPDIQGALQAQKAFGIDVILVGNEVKIKQVLQQHNLAHERIQIVHAADEILMTDKPGAILRGKKSSSMHVGMALVKNHEADAFVTMGNTGAALAVATFSSLGLGRIPGVKRAALTAIYPVNRRKIIFLDIGANADSKPEWLAQFALMGSIYAQRILGFSDARVALMSNGEEDNKGNQLVEEAQRLIQSLNVNYIGPVEPNDVLANAADVVVMDGFVGNVFMKTFEASIRYFGYVMREELKADLVSQVGGALSRSAFSRVRTRLDTGEVGGAPLLGVDGVAIVGHGSGDATAVKNAINQARIAVESDVIQIMRQHVQQT